MERPLCWIVSYPKSGNTWTRLLLARLLEQDGEAGATGTRDTGLFHGASLLFSQRMPFDRSTGLDSTELDEAEIDELRAPAWRAIARQAQSPMLVKAHDAWRCTAGGEAIFPADVSRGAIYLVRDPRDVAVSYAHHSGHGDFARTVAKMSDPKAAAAGGHHQQLRQVTYGWSGHYRSWHGQREIPVLTIRYEDMLADTAGCLTRMARFLGIDAARDPRRIAYAVEASSFAAMRAREEEQGFSERPEKSRRFFRSGRSGEGRETLPENLQQELLAVHGGLMEELGYIAPGDPASGRSIR